MASTRATPRPAPLDQAASPKIGHSSEAELAELIAAELAAGRLPDAKSLRARLRPPSSDLPVDRPVALTPLAHFDRLMEARP